LPVPSRVALAVLVAGLVAAAAIDIRTRRIPNGLTALMSGLGIAMAATGMSGLHPAAACVGFALGLLLMMPGYALGATGAGDVKLMAAVGAIVGPGLVVTAFLFTAIAGGVLAVVVAARRGRVAAALAGTGRLIVSPTGAKQEIRMAGAAHRFAYGPAIAIGSVLAAFSSSLF
jgi:prepilin peptidase CpaA